MENDTFLYVLATSQPLVSAVLIQGRVGSSSRVFQRRTERSDTHAKGSPGDYISHFREVGMTQGGGEESSRHWHLSLVSEVSQAERMNGISWRGVNMLQARTRWGERHGAGWILTAYRKEMRLGTCAGTDRKGS